MPFDNRIIDDIINEARKNRNELPYIEFKVNNYKPESIGEYISALSNTATLFNQDHALMIWGIDDKTHEIVGTTFSPKTEKYGGQSLELWLATHLKPQIQFYFHETEIESKKVILLEISPASTAPVKFKDVAYIRIESNKTRLKDYPDTERELWAIFSKKPFETLIAMENVSADIVLRLLDYSAYFELLSALDVVYFSSKSKDSLGVISFREYLSNSLVDFLESSINLICPSIRFSLLWFSNL